VVEQDQEGEEEVVVLAVLAAAGVLLDRRDLIPQE
jgi:hypothetical protein